MLPKPTFRLAFRLLLVFALCVGLPFACQREELSPEQSEQPADVLTSITIQEAQTWFESTNKGARKGYKKHKPRWDKAVQKRYRNSDTYVQAPLEDSVQIKRIVYDSTTHTYYDTPELQLIIYKDKKGKEQSLVMDLQSEGNYAQKHPGYSLDVDFSGLQLLYDMDGELRNGFQYQAGALTAVLRPLPADRQAKGRTSGQECESLTTYSLRATCRGILPWNPSGVTLYHRLVTLPTGQYFNPYAIPRPAGDIDESCTNWEVENSVESQRCYYVPDPPVNPGPGAGSGSGVTYLLNMGPQKFSVDNKARPCLGNLLAKMKQNANLVADLDKIGGVSGSANLAAILKQLTAAGNNINIVIREQDFVDKNAYTLDEKGVVYINFSRAYLNKATDLAIVRTLMHESIHAYFLYGLKLPLTLNDPDFKGTYDELFRKNGQPRLGAYRQNLQHEQMAKALVGEISKHLTAYGSFNYVDFPPSILPGYVKVNGKYIKLSQYYEELAWGGLQETNAYLRFVRDKGLNQAVLIQEQDNRAGSSNTSNCN